MSLSKLEKINYFAVIGDPIYHSLSPVMHNAAFKSLNLKAHYLRVAVKDKSELLKLFKTMPLKGINVTAPFKKELFTICDKVSEAARFLGVVNSIVSDDAKLCGYNTDPDGAVKPLLARNFKLEDCHILILGAGGAARAASYAFLKAGAKLSILNRSEKSLLRLKEDLNLLFKDIPVSCYTLQSPGIDELFKKVNVVVSCISTAEKFIPAKYLRPEHTVFDAYYAQESRLVCDAKKTGAQIISGQEWLLYQGFSAFKHFTGLDAPQETMDKALSDYGSPVKKGIALIGFMASGKTSVAKEFCKQCARKLVDLDYLIEKQVEQSISSIFKEEGEAYFRELELQALKDTIAEDSAAVVACGGGIIKTAEAIKLLKDNYHVVWLWADADTLYNRAAKSNSRPLLEGKDQDFVAKLLAERCPAYAEASDLLINTEGYTVKQLCQRLLRELKLN